MFGLQGWKGFSKDVGSHVVGRTVLETDLLLFDSVADEMEADVDVFGASMKTVVLCKSDGGLVVRVDSDWCVDLAKDFRDEVAKIDSFFGSMSESDILSFGGRE